MSSPSHFLDKLRFEHRRLLAACDALDAMVAGPYPDAVERLAELRWNYTREMLMHFANVETGALQPLMGDRRPDAAARAARSSQDLRNVYDNFMRHVRRWHGSPAEESWSEYRQALALLTRRIRVRLAAEETDIHPLLPAQPGSIRVASVTEPINYAAEAWRIRALVSPVENRMATG